VDVKRTTKRFLEVTLLVNAAEREGREIMNVRNEERDYRLARLEASSKGGQDSASGYSAIEIEGGR
jgi:hypothetical protein